MSTIDKLNTLFHTATIEQGVAADEADLTVTQQRDAAKNKLLEIELRDARDKLDAAFLSGMRASLIDCIDSYTDAYQAQQSYTLDMFINLPLSLNSILNLIDVLQSRLNNFNLDLPNSLTQFRQSAMVILQDKYKKKPIKNKTDAMASLDDES